MDNTYKTNKYRQHLFEIVGIMSIELNSFGCIIPCGILTNKDSLLAIRQVETIV